MKDFTFSVPQEILFGSGSLNRLPELLKKQKAARVLLVSGPHLNKMGIVGRIRDSIAAAGIACEVFTDVEANPSIETVEKAAQIYMLTAHLPRVNTIRDDQMKELAEYFGVNYRKDFLDL